MVKHFDELAKALAAGVPRRVALRRFAGGLAGAALATVIPGQAALAAGGKVGCADYCEKHPHNGVSLGTCINQCVHECIGVCREMYGSGADYALCIARSEKCPPGQCAPHVTNTSNVCHYIV